MRAMRRSGAARCVVPPAYRENDGLAHRSNRLGWEGHGIVGAIDGPAKSGGIVLREVMLTAERDAEGGWQQVLPCSGGDRSKLDSARLGACRRAPVVFQRASRSPRERL